MKKLIFYISLITIIVPINISAQWQYQIINYDRGVYQAGFQNWNMTQAQNGWMYFANSKGLLEYDGVYWKLYPLKNRIVHSVKLIDNKIYVGGSSEFGFFDKDKAGNMLYHSLSDTLRTWGGEVWSITTIDNNIFFIADNYIFTVDRPTNKVKTAVFGVKIDYCSTVIDNKLYAATTQGLFILNQKNNQLEPVEGAEILKGKKLVGLAKLNDKIIITTNKSGIYVLDGNNCQKIATPVEKFIADNQLFCSLVLGSKMALGSVSNGVCLFDFADAGFIKYFNQDTGLANNTALSIFCDRDKNLWLGLDKGIAYVNINSPVQPLFALNSPIGTGYCSMVYNGELYLGTNQGLYKADQRGDYQMIANTEGQIWSMSIIDGKLFASGDNGIAVVSPQEVYRINYSGAWSVQPLSTNPNTVIVGTYQGFLLLDKINGRWENIRRINDFYNSCRGFTEDEIPNVFWVANASGSMVRLTIDADKAQIVARKTYALPNTTVGANSFISKMLGNIVVCGEKGIFMYNRISDAFEPFKEVESILEGNKYYDFLQLDRFKNIWYVTDMRLKMLAWENAKYAAQPIDLGINSILVDKFENVTCLDSANAVVAVEKAFVKVNFKNINSKKLPANVFIRRILLSQHDTVIIYYSENQKIKIPYSQNSFTIYFGATDFQNSGDLSYSYRLVGLDNQWSAPSAKTTKEYTDLSEGKYTFEVKAFFNGNENQSITTKIEFRILPPWYRSTMAYIVYFLILMAIFYYIYKNTIRKQQNIIRQKRQELEQQSQLHVQEKQQKDKTIDELQNEKLQMNLDFKSQELSGYILNLIRKNEMLENVKKDVLNISKDIDEGTQSSTIKQKLVRLTSLINNNIEHDDDFEIFKSNFDIIHKGFFKSLEEKFPKLTRNEKIVCAYIKMNLSSKEIAALQNISPRAVEINRYRLRKKLNLTREKNLTEFIHSI